MKNTPRTTITPLQREHLNSLTFEQLKDELRRANQELNSVALSRTSAADAKRAEYSARVTYIQKLIAKKRPRD